MLENNIFEGFILNTVSDNERIHPVINLLYVANLIGHTMIPLAVDVNDGFLKIEQDMEDALKISEDIAIMNMISEANEALKGPQAIEDLKNEELLVLGNRNDSLAFIGAWNLEKHILNLIQLRSIDNVLSGSDFDRLFLSKISFITGCAGSGKTHKVSEFIKDTMQKHKNVTFGVCAPTGKAVDVVRDTILEHRLGLDMDRIEFNTIHTMFGIRVSVELEPAEIKMCCHDFIIVDESSMLSNRIFLRIMRSVSSYSRLIFVGDTNQLPPMGMGAIFNSLDDMSEDLKINKIVLSGNRRSSNLYINDIANSLIEGVFRIDQVDFVGYNGADKILEKFMQDVGMKDWIIMDYNQDIERFIDIKDMYKILAITNSGICGVDYINIYINKRLEIIARQCGAIGFAFPAISTINQKIVGISNGTSVVVINYINQNQKNRCLYKFNGEIKNLSSLYIRGVIPAWALTVHKSQGSAYENVTIVVNSYKNFTRSYLYTAITRARHKVSISALLGSDLDQSCFMSRIHKKDSRFSCISRF